LRRKYWLGTSICYLNSGFREPIFRFTFSIYDTLSGFSNRRTGSGPHRVHVIDGLRGAGVGGNFHSGWLKHQRHLGRGQHSIKQCEFVDQLIDFLTAPGIEAISSRAPQCAFQSSARDCSASSRVRSANVRIVWYCCVDITPARFYNTTMARYNPRAQTRRRVAECLTQAIAVPAVTNDFLHSIGDKKFIWEC
jgi:hypothetical protein